MAEIADLHAALTARELPTVTMWNRLEGRPRLATFDRALRAEVRDALWMLARQWQLGELFGDDAGSPVYAKVHVSSAPFTKYRAHRGDAREFPSTVPLEAVVEARPVPFVVGDVAVSLDVRTMLGRRWLRLVRDAVGDFDEEFVAAYPVRVPDPDDPADAHVVAHPDVWQQVAALAGRVMDGYELYVFLRDPAHHAYDGTTIDPADFVAVDELAGRFVTWAESIFFQPGGFAGGSDAWKPSQLEYQFAVSAPRADGGERVYVAEEYYHGRLDWYGVDLDPAQDGLPIPGDPPTPGVPAPTTTSFVPAQVAFEGMPNTRWWAFEDRRTSFGDITPDTTDLAKLLLMEFGLVYANDWYVVPHPLPAGSVAHVAGLAVTNVFGERFWIEPSGSGADDDWQRWAMFTTSVRGVGGAADAADLVLLPTVPKIQEGRPLEEVRLVRDEMANLVWGVEARVPLASGGSRPGEELARETLAFHRRLLDAAIAGGAVVPVADDARAPIRYRAMSTVAENWIPFVPVHVPGDNREIQLQRAALPRFLEGDPAPPTRVRPRTTLLREGLDRDPAEPYFVFEEEVPRSGVTVTQGFQRTRWYDGRVVTWLGVRKQVSPPGRSSGLRFDYLKPQAAAGETP